MTVGELIKELQAANPDLPVVVECEVRCDPHPVTSTFVAKGGSGTGVTYLPYVSIFADSNEDFQWRIHEEADDDH